MNMYLNVNDLNGLCVCECGVGKGDNCGRFLPGYHFAVETWWQSGRRLVFADDVRFIGFYADLCFFYVI